MPGGDRTGPMGLGPRSGGGFGYCNRYAVPFGRRFFGMGRGGFRGFGRWDYAPYAGYPGTEAAPYTAQEEINVLKEQAGGLQDELKYVRQRISELESNRDKENK